VVEVEDWGASRHYSRDVYGSNLSFGVAKLIRTPSQISYFLGNMNNEAFPSYEACQIVIG